MSPTLDELRAFLAVYEAQSFTAASKRLGLTTNAVSLRVQRLEDALGARLLSRTTRRVAPTEEGRGLYERAALAIAELEHALDELGPSTGLRGAVRLAVPGVLATGPLLSRVRELLDAHEGLGVQVRVISAPIDLVAEGIDLGVVVGQLPQTTFVGRLLGRVSWVLAAAPRYLERHGRPTSPDDLTDHRCLRLLATPPQREWTLVDRKGRQRTVAVGGAFEADDSRALGDATYAGLGIGVRPAGECARAEREGRLERVLPGYRFAPLDVFALAPKGRLRLPRVAACLEVLRQAVEELA